MKLYLMRHGEAMSSDVNPRNPLSQRGRSEVRSVAHHLNQMGVKIHRIECSTKERAMQTAEIMACVLGDRDAVSVRDGMKPNDPIGFVLEELRQDQEDRMLVGHLPYMPKLAAALLGDSENNHLSFSTATVACLMGEAGEAWKLEWMVGPESA